MSYYIIRFIAERLVCDFFSSPRLVLSYFLKPVTNYICNSLFNKRNATENLEDFFEKEETSSESSVETLVFNVIDNEEDHAHIKTKYIVLESKYK